MRSLKDPDYNRSLVVFRFQRKVIGPKWTGGEVCSIVKISIGIVGPVVTHRLWILQRIGVKHDAVAIDGCGGGNIFFILSGYFKAGKGPPSLVFSPSELSN